MVSGGMGFVGRMGFALFRRGLETAGARGVDHAGDHEGQPVVPPSRIGGQGERGVAFVGAGPGEGIGDVDQIVDVGVIVSVEEERFQPPEDVVGLGEPFREAGEDGEAGRGKVGRGEGAGRDRPVQIVCHLLLVAVDEVEGYGETVEPVGVPVGGGFEEGPQVRRAQDEGEVLADGVLFLGGREVDLQVGRVFGLDADGSPERPGVVAPDPFVGDGLLRREGQLLRGLAGGPEGLQRAAREGLVGEVAEDGGRGQIGAGAALDGCVAGEAVVEQDLLPAVTGGDDGNPASRPDAVDDVGGVAQLPVAVGNAGFGHEDEGG